MNRETSSSGGDTGRMHGAPRRMVRWTFGFEVCGQTIPITVLVNPDVGEGEALETAQHGLMAKLYKEAEEVLIPSSRLKEG